MCAQQQLGEVDEAGSPTGSFVVLIDIEQGAALRIIAMVDRLGPFAFVLGAVDEPGRLTRRKAGFVQAHAGYDALDQPLLVVRIENLEGFRQLRLAPMPAQQTVRDAMESADGEPACAAGDEILAAAAHLARGFIGERHGKNRIRRDALDLEQPRDTMRQHARLAGAGASEHEIMVRRRGDCVALSLIEGVEQVGHVHPRILPLPLRVLALFGLVALSARSEAMLRYELAYRSDAETMRVVLCADAAVERRFVLDRDAETFVSGLERDHGAIERTPRDWLVRDWRDGECLRYTAALGRIADRGESDVGLRFGADLVVAPTQWLLDTAHDGAAEVRMILPVGVSISAPWEVLPDEGAVQRFHIPLTPRSWAASVAFGRFARREIVLGNGTLHVALPGIRDAVTQARLFGWIDAVGRAALSAYGRLPVSDVQVLVLPSGLQRQAVVFGQSQRGQGHGLLLMVDAARPLAEFSDDWTAVHELAHLFHVYLGDDGRWLAEGLASYWQNVLRARAGLLTPAQAWERLDAGFSRGRADVGAAQRLDHAPRTAFMRIYWAGAAYWLGVDAELRRASGGKKSLELALDRFAGCCLPATREWTPREFVLKLDALIDAEVFVSHFDMARTATTFPDLDRLYATLGIVKAGPTLRFDDTAPAAAVRRAIMAPR